MHIFICKIKITGKKPMLINSFNEESLSRQGKEKTGEPGKDPGEWKRTVLKTGNGQLYLRGDYIFGCLRDGGKHIRQSKTTLQAKIAATLIVIDEIVLLDRFLPNEEDLTRDQTKPVYLDVRPVKNPSTKARNIRYRVAVSSGWQSSFRIQWDASVVSKAQMESALINAGNLVGLGDGRSIGFGRFEVENFEVQESEK